MNSVIITEFRELNKLYYFFFLCLISVLLIYTGNKILITEDLYYEFLQSQLSPERIAEFIIASKNWEWVVYVVIPIYYLFKFFSVASCLSTGILLAGYNANFKKIFQIALIAEAVFLIPPILRLVWFGFINKDYTYEELQSFVPLSIFSLMGGKDIKPWFIYPTQVLNIFELFYWFILAYGIRIVLKNSYRKSFLIVLFSYGTALSLWIILIIFFNLSFL